LDKLEDGKVVFERCFYLKKWPSRLVGVSKRLDIIVHALEEFTPKWVLTKSTVYVNYLIVSNSKAKLVQSLHYDFDANARPTYPHPIFHVQLNVEFVRFSENELRSMGFDAELDVPQEHNECRVTSRIPTPEMTFPSVLYCLVADHLGAGIFKDFAEDVDPMLKEQLPHPDIALLKTSLRESPAHIKSSHWFAR